jgi:hypothetical protein
LLGCIARSRKKFGVNNAVNYSIALTRGRAHQTDNRRSQTMKSILITALALAAMFAAKPAHADTQTFPEDWHGEWCGKMTADGVGVIMTRQTWDCSSVHKVIITRNEMNNGGGEECKLMKGRMDDEAFHAELVCHSKTDPNWNWKVDFTKTFQNSLVIKFTDPIVVHDGAKPKTTTPPLPECNEVHVEDTLRRLTHITTVVETKNIPSKDPTESRFCKSEVLGASGSLVEVVYELRWTSASEGRFTLSVQGGRVM